MMELCTEIQNIMWAYAHRDGRPQNVGSALCWNGKRKFRNVLYQRRRRPNVLQSFVDLHWATSV